ncbi:type II toxin-antitoxin system VapC family toxin [Silvibacterium acidisoli]|uniref:type II toxin-antitoxin system VapC family toxin n=1 Tax=Acidobacteriaceae bacterium ZG23-2 TaxID=2883246 RepID=UPI00406D4F89
MIVLDTHVILWLALEPDGLSRPATAAIQQARLSSLSILISGISLYEIARASERGRIDLQSSTEAFFERVLSTLTVRPVSPSVSLIAAKLPAAFPGDPADRIIAATAISEGASLITADQHIRRSRAVKTVW